VFRRSWTDGHSGNTQASLAVNARFGSSQRLRAQVSTARYTATLSSEPRSAGRANDAASQNRADPDHRGTSRRVDRPLGGPRLDRPGLSPGPGTFPKGPGSGSPVRGLRRSRGCRGKTGTRPGDGRILSYDHRGRAGDVRRRGGRRYTTGCPPSGTLLSTVRGGASPGIDPRSSTGDALDAPNLGRAPPVRAAGLPRPLFTAHGGSATSHQYAHAASRRVRGSGRPAGRRGTVGIDLCTRDPGPVRFCHPISELVWSAYRDGLESVKGPPPALQRIPSRGVFLRIREPSFPRNLRRDGHRAEPAPPVARFDPVVCARPMAGTRAHDPRERCARTPSSPWVFPHSGLSFGPDGSVDLGHLIATVGVVAPDGSRFPVLLPSWGHVLTSLWLAT